MGSYLVRVAIAAVVVACTGNIAEAGELVGKVVGATGSSPAVVWIEGLASSALPTRDTVLTYRHGQLRPFVDIGFVGNAFVLRNEDDKLHNVHLYLRLAYQKEVSQRPLEYGATLFNVALPKAGTEVRKPIQAHYRYRDETGFIEVACNPHPEERSYILVFDHPYAAVTAEDGTFSIPNLPAGNHQVRVWHAGSVKKEKTVKIEADAPTVLEIDAS